VTPPGIDPGTVRIVAQRLNHYATPGPVLYIYIYIYIYIYGERERLLHLVIIILKQTPQPIHTYSKNILLISNLDLVLVPMFGPNNTTTIRTLH
jgi:hypothetical protein